MQIEEKLWVFVGFIMLIVAIGLECYRYRAWRGTGKLTPLAGNFVFFLGAVLIWPATIFYIYSLIRMEDVQ